MTFFLLHFKLLTELVRVSPRAAFRAASVTTTFQATREPSTQETFRLGLPSTAALNIYK